MSDQTLSSLLTLAVLLILLLWAFLIDFLLHLRRQRSSEPTASRRSEGGGESATIAAIVLSARSRDGRMRQTLV